MHIGRVIAKEQPDAAAALRFFARQCSIDLDDGAIREHTEMYRKELGRWKSESR